MNNNKQQLVLDIRGQICPSCLLIALKEVTINADKLNNKEMSILILSDDRHATATIPDAVHSMGFSTTISKTDDGYEILINKK
ncbi:MAG: sulfurtransferase TusA family protein [Gammaproteobacteria bacterium]|nr:sulfurtransferase TusA family protein [Gammaproteobacteria bacterium]MCW8987630.1 sulfurtransferase TusA family protein [Gammaproteobacteria bacterium]MCW9029925.1 sulfurtransferase TusA family protein [Gammaproteobacteria bacterium]